MTPIDTNSETAFSETRAPVSAFREAPEENTVNLIDLALVLAVRKRFIFLWGFVAAVITAIIVLIVPVTFTATTTMLPPQRENSASMLLGQIGGLASLVGGGGGAASVLGLKNPDDLYIGLLQSETVEDGIVDRFHLTTRYKAKRKSDARNALKARTKIVAEKSSLISIAVKSHDPKEAAAIANAYVAQLHLLLSHLSVTEAAQRRVFFSQQAEEEKNKLADAEVALETTEQKTGIIQPQGQAQAVIATIMQLRAQISVSEVELAALRTSATDQNSQVVTLQSQIAGLKAQLSDFEKGHPGAAAVAGNVLTPTTQVPAASLAYIRKMRDVRYHEALYEFMARQYEMARVDEAKQGQVIQVVDPALVPDRKSWPPRTLLTLLAFVLGILFASFWTLVNASYQHRILKDPELKAKSEQLRRTLLVRKDVHP
jgi:tyrosine-protein kinase Etk/Wzc